MLDTERLPCLATLAPAAAATTHAPVEMFTVPALRSAHWRRVTQTNRGLCAREAARQLGGSAPRRAPVATGADDIQDARAGVNSNAAAAHSAREARDLGRRLALGTQEHQKRCRLRRVGRLQQRLAHGAVSAHEGRGENCTTR